MQSILVAPQIEVGHPSEGLTRSLVRRALSVRFDSLPPEVLRVARDCLTDWMACTLAGASEPAGELVAAYVAEEGGAQQATLLGRGYRASAVQAALVNGTASHALDYDDVNLTLPGHVSVAVYPGLLALAEQRDSCGSDVIAAFVAGYETTCRIGALMQPSHYALGFHATATLGSLGAAVACSHLLQLSALQTCHAIGIAATQSAGLKAMFGTMAKPLHAGQAAQVGLRAALLAHRGFTSRTDILECTQGFADVYGTDFHAENAVAQPPGGYHLMKNLFKFHASCFSTHSTIEAVNALRCNQALKASDVSRIQVVVGEACAICNIQHPGNGLEAKFSLRAAAAFALLGIETAELKSWDRVSENSVRDVLERVQVQLVPGKGMSESVVTLETGSGQTLQTEVDVGAPVADKVEQSRRVAEKFRSITLPVVGADRCARLLKQIESIEFNESVAVLMRECRIT